MFNHVELYPLPERWHAGNSTAVEGELPHVPSDSMISRPLAAKTAGAASGLPVIAIGRGILPETVTTSRPPQRGFTVRPPGTVASGKHQAVGRPLRTRCMG